MIHRRLLDFLPAYARCSPVLLAAGVSICLLALGNNPLAAAQLRQTIRRAGESQSPSLPALPSETRATQQQPVAAPENATDTATVTQPPQPQGLADTTQTKKLLEAAQNDESLPEEVRRRIQDKLAVALKNQERREKAEQQILDLRAAADSAKARKEAAEEALGETPTIEFGEIGPTSPAEAIAGLIKRLEADLATATKRATAIHEQINQRRTESKELPQTVATLEEELAKISLTAENDTELNPFLAKAIAHEAESHQQALTAELELSRQKLVTYEAEAAVLPLEQQQYDKRAATLTEALGRASSWASRRRQTEIQTQITAFRSLVEQTGAAEEFEETFALFDQWAVFIANTQHWNGLLLRTREATERLRNDYYETESLVDADRATGSGLSRAAGSLLKRKRVMLSRTRTALGEAGTQAAAIDDAQDVLADIDTLLDEISQQPTPTDDSAEARLVNQQRSLLEAMNADFDHGLVDTLIPLGVQFEVLSRQIDDYGQLIDKNVLWVRSDKPVRLIDLWHLTRFAGWIQPERVLSVARSFFVGVSNRPILAGAVLFAAVLFIVLHRWFVVRVTALGSSLSGVNSMRLRPTVQATLYSVFAAVPVWLPLAAISWFLGEFAAPDSTEGYVADSLSVAAAVLLPLEVLRQLIRPHGVAMAHFAWTDSVIQPLRRAVRHTTGVGLVLVFLARFLLLERTTHSELSPLARIAFTVLMVFVSVILRRLLDRKSGVSAAILARRPDGILARLAWFWRPLVIILPLLLAFLSLAGYAFAANQLAVSLYKSIWAIVAAAIFHGLAMRWLLVSKRRIALQQLREQSALREQAGISGTTSDMLHVNQLKLSDIDQQTRRLIDATIVVGLLVAIYWTWAPVIPALSFLDAVVLWTLNDADGTVTSVVTLNNVLIAIPTLLLTFVLVRNVPGLLEAALLQKLPLDNATRYAITSLSSYLVAFCGLLLAAGTLGLRWSSVQWLAAGLSVGLGFGLQEVVANFVCGLILLFEQPIRVGDVVTLDTISGVVSRIRIRATTVTTWERQEYVIPNKDLITGRVINWTLSDSVNRAELRVGVAYGTDTRRVETLLRELCLGIPEILNDPPPIITFEEFGDSTLNFMVRFYLASLDNRLVTISELHNQVHERFNTEGIEIAFPQVDIHMKTQSFGPPAIS